MLLSPQEAALFFKLHRAFMWFVNRELKVVRDTEDPDEYSGLPIADRLKVHEAFVGHPELLEQFVRANPFQFSPAALDIILSWRHHVSGKFYIYRHLSKYSVFVDACDPPIAYGVVGLTDPLEELVGPTLPRLVNTTLLPFGGKIIYDGLLGGYSVTFGPGVLRSLKDAYRKAMERHGLVTSLPIESAQSTKSRGARRSKPKTDSRARGRDQDSLDAVLALLEPFCSEHLNNEYAGLCRRLAEKLARQRPSPLTRGTPNSWATGVVRVIGGINFLHDRAQNPYMKASEIDAAFGVSESTGSAKATLIRKLLKLDRFDPEWMLRHVAERNPLLWMVEINGFLIDIRETPREIQEQAFAEGIIPFLPEIRSPQSK